MRRIRTISLLIAALAVCFSALYCNGPDPSAEAAAAHPDMPWRNVYDTSARYVGMETCRGCHDNIYQTFIKTGMGQSFDRASRAKSAADFRPEHAIVYDKDLDFYYRPYWSNDSFYIMEYRLEGKDTVHKRVQQVDYIIGSGQHTNSHLYNINGYFYQAPITFYTQKQQWDLAPGFEKGASSRFSRLIESECMTCHNGYPKFVAESQNKYESVPHGIDCERCHGPGSLHVSARQSGRPVDTSQTPDYSIVNPRRLSTELQNNICQRCHLQGISVLNDGKSFFDFRPGMRLSEVMNVFMPQYEGAQDKMIMASHVERMKKSPCYVSSGKMSCITCHNPHVSVKFTPRAQYLNACASCHGGAKQVHCSESEAVRMKKGNDCVTCHMPHNGSIDIPHVAVTDHYIRKRPLQDTLKSAIRAFLGMRCFNDDHPGDLTTARAFMEFFERYNTNNGLLDSAQRYLDRDPAGEQARQNRDYIRLSYLRNDYPRILQYAAALKPEAVSDAWTAYRIGEGYYRQQQPDAALPWFARATAIWKYSLDFQTKYGSCLIATGKLAEAQKTFEFVLSQNPNVAVANTNLGFLYMQQRNGTMAFDYLRRAIALDPDNEQALLNMAVWYHDNQQPDQAGNALRRLLKRHPDNERARMMLQSL